MISAGDFRNGVTFEMDGNVVQIIEFQHVKPGKGAAFVRTKIRNVISGSVTEKTFNPTDKFPTAYVERKDMQYLYSDGDLYYFMDNETYENIPISKDVLGDNFKFVKENMDCKVLSYKGKVFGVEPPFFLKLSRCHGNLSHPDRSGLQGRHRHQRDQARGARDRRRDPRPALHQRGRPHQGRHPHRGVYGARVTC